MKENVVNTKRWRVTYKNEHGILYTKWYCLINPAIRYAIKRNDEGFKDVQIYDRILKTYR